MRFNNWNTVNYTVLHFFQIIIININTDLEKKIFILNFLHQFLLYRYPYQLRCVVDA